MQDVGAESQLFILYMGMKNDVSFIITDIMSIYEQATYNPNMPVRELMDVWKTLGEYAWLIQRIREYSRYKDIEEAVDKAIDELPEEFEIFFLRFDLRIKSPVQIRSERYPVFLANMPPAVPQKTLTASTLCSVPKQFWKNSLIHSPSAYIFPPVLQEQFLLFRNFVFIFSSLV